MKKKFLFGAAIYIGLIFICVGVVYLLPSIKGMLVKTYIVEQGEIELSDDVELCIVRNEDVYVAEKAYNIKRLISAGELSKSFSKAVELSSGGEESQRDKYKRIIDALGDNKLTTSTGVTQYAGNVCYSVDGAEGKLNSQSIKEMKRSELEQLAKSELVKTPNRSCAKGEPVFKLVKTGKWYMVFFVNNKSAKYYYEGKTISVRFDDNELKAKVIYLNKEGKSTRVVLSCGESYKGYLTDRSKSATVVSSSARGLVVKTSSLVKKDGKLGVLVKNKFGRYNFVEVKVKAELEDECVVSQDIFMDDTSNYVETIGIYDELALEPSEKDIENAK